MILGNANFLSTHAQFDFNCQLKLGPVWNSEKGALNGPFATGCPIDVPFDGMFENAASRVWCMKAVPIFYIATAAAQDTR